MQFVCCLLRCRTRVLVTHQLQFLSAADLVIVMAEGRVLDMGTQQQLLARGIDFHKFVAEPAKDTDSDDLQSAAGPDQGTAGSAGGDKAAASASGAAESVAAGPEAKEAGGAPANPGKSRKSLDAKLALRETLAKKEKDGA